MDFKEAIKDKPIPKHIAIIMDGNGRWAKQKGHERIYGHIHGVDSVRKVTEAAAEIGVKYLTLYAFSTENWNRPQEEVDALMELLVDTIHKEVSTLNKNNIRLQTIGETDKLPLSCQENLKKAIEETKNNNALTLILALNYGSRCEITSAVKKIAEEVNSGKLNASEISEKIISQSLYTSAYPDPELLIRTSGEKRISNYLLWQIAYSELYFTETLWPDFKKENLFEAIYNYQQRERRFGKTSEQITQSH